jgi:hypothetical protein
MLSAYVKPYTSGLKPGKIVPLRKILEPYEHI